MTPLADIVAAIGYPLNVVLIVALFWSAIRFKDARRFWGLLAAAWTVGFLGNVVWVIHDVVTGRVLPNFSPVDLFYLARYALVAMALWRAPRPLPRRRLLETLAVVALAMAAGWPTIFRPAWETTGRSWGHLIGGAIYPILDAGIIYLALIRWRTVEAPGYRAALAWLFWGLISYGVANWINFSSRVIAFESFVLGATIFWLLSDILTGAALVSYARQRREAGKV